MKVGAGVPKSVKRPVRVTETVYEAWYARPVSLGKIEKKAQKWHTADGMRFVSSKDATEYLAKIYELERKITPEVVKPITQEKKNQIKKEMDAPKGKGASGGLPPNITLQTLEELIRNAVAGEREKHKNANVQVDV